MTWGEAPRSGIGWDVLSMGYYEDIGSVYDGREARSAAPAELVLGVLLAGAVAFVLMLAVGGAYSILG
jgi:hypothetical protein